jgi:hypothetical protein
MTLDLNTTPSPTRLPPCRNEPPWQATIKLVTAITLLAVVLVLHPVRALAQSMEPRTYSNAPVGMNFLILGYVYQKGNVLLDPSVPVKDVTIKAHTAVAAYSRVIDVFGKSGRVDLVVPYSRLTGSGTIGEREQERKMAGFADPAARFSVNLYGAPALTLEEFKNYRQDTIVGVSLMATAPLGQYDDDKAANIGSNRWSFKPEVGVSQAIGSWTVEAIGGVTFFTDNDDYFGGHKREQEPIYSLQGHLIYSFQSGIWAALDATYYSGGKTSLDGVQGDDEQGNVRVGATLTFPININHSIKLYGSTAVETRVGGDFNILGIAWQYRWGAGL